MAKKGEVIGRLKRDLTLYLMIILPILFVFLFSYVPMTGLVFAFKKYKSVDGFIRNLLYGRWIGLEYFKDFIGRGNFLAVLRNTFLLSIYSLFWGFPAPIILALLLNEVKNEKFKRITQTISYLPHFISTVIIVGMMMQILSPQHGIVNIILRELGAEKSTYFMIKPEWFRTLYISSGIWQGVGWGSILYIATISSIDPQLYEAAEIDGASRFRKVLHVTLPGLLPTIIIVFLMRIGNILNVGFEKILLMQGTSTTTYPTSDVIDTYVYRHGIGLGDFGYATAVGLFKSLVGISLLTLANRASRKLTETSLW